MSTIIEDRLKEITCDFCDHVVNESEISTRYWNYEKHLRFYHRGINLTRFRIPCPFSICVVKSKSYSTIPNLVRHIRQLHFKKGIRQEQSSCEYLDCKKIGKTFSSVSSKNRHIREFHHGQKRNHNRWKSDKDNFRWYCTYPECKVTNRNYKTKKYLRDHIRRVHLKTKQATCPYEICKNKVFTRKSSINQHIKKVHLGLSRVKCFEKECLDGEYYFFDKHKLKRHVETVHNKSTYVTCKICNIQLSDKLKLTRHLKTNSCDSSVEKWKKWEALCHQIATAFYGEEGTDWFWHSKIYLQSQDYVIPDIRVPKYDLLIDAKLSRYALMPKDIFLYPTLADRTEFWVLYGNSSDTEAYSILSSSKLMSKLWDLSDTSAKGEKRGIQQLINQIQQFRNNKEIIV